MNECDVFKSLNLIKQNLHAVILNNKNFEMQINLFLIKMTFFFRSRQGTENKHYPWQAAFSHSVSFAKEYYTCCVMVQNVNTLSMFTLVGIEMEEALHNLN